MAQAWAQIDPAITSEQKSRVAGCLFTGDDQQNADSQSPSITTDYV